MSECFFIGVDVGTGSARAGLFTDKGELIAHAERKLTIWNETANHFEQSSDDIWQKCCEAVREITRDPKTIRGIGFDATCSLVCLDRLGKPLSVSSNGSNERNIIMWMDHRAGKEANFINSKNHRILKYVGGKVSLEMEMPKLLWLKTYMKQQCWDRAGYFFDLPDFLTWKATDCDSRSLCSLVCKWNYEASERDHGWNQSFLQQIGLEDLLESPQKIGTTVLAPGEPCGRGLSPRAAQDLGLLPGIPVGASIIDAHAGGLGMVGCSLNESFSDVTKRLNLICGTSTCHMIVSTQEVFVPGVWGPYYSAMVPKFWLSEGGQSATGKLVDHVIESHPAYAGIQAKLAGRHIQVYLTELLEDLARQRNFNDIAYLTNDLHVYPDFHGNRSPIGDPTVKGMITGLSLSKGEEDLAVLYLATIQSLAYGTLHIIESLKKAGHKDINSIVICGGLSKNPLFIQTQADVSNMRVLRPKSRESVLLGAAMLGACASRHFTDVQEAVVRMSGDAELFTPNVQLNKYHRKKYRVFLRMFKDQMEYRLIMNSS